MSLYAGIFKAAASADEDEDAGAGRAAGAADAAASRPADAAAPSVAPRPSAVLSFAPRFTSGSNKNKSKGAAPKVLVGFQDAADAEVVEDAQGRHAGPSSPPQERQAESTTSPLQPPPLSLPQEEMEADRAMARRAAEERGEKRPLEEDEPADGHQMDEDVNGFYASEKGRRVKKKKKRRPAAAATVNMDGDYDPRVPNDYSAFKELLRTRRRILRERQRELEGSDESDEEERSYSERTESAFAGRRFAPPPTYDDKPYLSPPPPPPPPPAEEEERRHALTQASSADEIYARRLAMTQALQRQREGAAAAEPATAAPHDSGGVRPAEAGLGAPTETPAPAPSVGPSPQDSFEARKSAAAAIAAKLAQAKPVQPKPSFLPGASPPTASGATHRPDPAAFAARLMQKYGYKKGEGIGAEGNKGIVQPLAAAKADEKQAHRHQDEESRTARAMGKIVNENRDAKQEEERARFGVSSETVLLQNMVSVQDVDEELTGEIREECSKHGTVQNVVVHIAPDGVRVFVRFSGPVGAWKAVHDLDGRFFGGRTVRARYYPTVRFDQGDYEA